MLTLECDLDMEDGLKYEYPYDVAKLLLLLLKSTRGKYADGALGAPCRELTLLDRGISLLRKYAVDDDDVNVDVVVGFETYTCLAP